ncbi:unnamed protein product [Polarella glacialis]|uniref:Uncharacterized protein n=1 Tax=Polarella glacialis TaxID=89957 RepID=A0A813HQH2_POLGL|nr:unnamed protein product [Polarella glacialis]
MSLTDATGIRPATMGVFLNEPEKGGETAFPAVRSQEELSKWGYDESETWADVILAFAVAMLAVLAVSM